MQRGKYEAVTQELVLPVLIPATAEQQEGVATFQQELGAPTPVRRFKDSDLKDAAKHMTKAEARHFHAVVALTQALQNPSDTIALRNANAAFDEAYTLRRAEPSPFMELGEDFAIVLGRTIGVPPQEAVEIFDRKRPGPRAASDPRWMLSYAVSESLSISSQLVLWWTGHRFTPAIWCDDMKTAFYVRALLSAVGGNGLRICPHCSKPFVQKRPDQDYCLVAHREAHRVARWRAAKTKQRQRKGTKNGTRKTR
ncbi:MAG: hypothetical protein WB421_04365 [Terriglobales bacterium]